jgi:hypothetical protein
MSMPIRQKIRGCLFLMIILGGGAFLRFYKLGSLLFWEDDPVHQVRMAYQPLSFVIAHNNQTSLSTLLTHFLLSFGNIQFMARLGSAVFGVLVILLVFVLGKRLFSRTEGLMAAAFVSISPYLIQFSQYSRAYALFVLLAVLSFYFFWLAWRENRWRHWIFWALSTALAIYNHLVALLILPAYMIFMGLVWLEGRFVKTDPSERRRRNSQVKRFALVTAGLIALDVFLYWPNADIRGSLADFFHKTVTRPEWPSAGPGLIGYVLRYHIAIPVVRFLTLILAAVGVFLSWKKYRREMTLAALFMSVPYLLFILSHPTPSNTLAADRFFLFLLPLFLILAARGLVAISGLLSSSLTRGGPAPSPSRRKTLAWILAAMLAGGYFAGLRAYYVNFWRLSSWKVEPKVSRYLERNIKSDALVYVDSFPLSSLNMVVNPLTRDLRLEEAEFIIRKHLLPRPEKNDLLFYSLGFQEFRAFVAGLDVELWVVARLNAKARWALLQAIKNHPNIEVEMLDECAVLCFRRSGASAARKLSRMAGLFLSLPLDDTMRTRHFHLLAAKAALINDLAEDGYRQLAAYSRIRPSFTEHDVFRQGLAERALDQVFGLDMDELIARHDERLLFEARRLLFRLGNKFMIEGRPDQAFKAYLECLKWGTDMNDRVLEKLGPLLDQLLSRGMIAEGALLCEKALDIESRRDDFRFALAGSYWQMGNEKRAEEEYKKIFGLDSLSLQALQELSLKPEAAIIWNKGGVWHLLFRSDKACAFSGKIRAGRKIRGIETVNCDGSDVLKRSSSRVSFLVNTNRGLIKFVRLAVTGGTGLTIDLRANGRRDVQKVIILPAGRPGTQIPFTLD